MMHAELRRLHSPDAWDLRRFTPGDPEVYGILVQAMVGPKGAEGEESLDFTVCTPAWLAQELSAMGYQFGRYYLFLPRYNYDLLWKALYDLCDSTSGPNWQAIAQRLACYGQWEFEDYRPFVDPNG
jgi:hypothetical protein